MCFTKDVVETWLEDKGKKEVDVIRLRPHPYEFAPYFDIWFSLKKSRSPFDTAQDERKKRRNY